MELERIKRRIDESIEKLNVIYQSKEVFTDKEKKLISDIKEISREAVKAFQIYRALVIGLCGYAESGVFRDVQELEEKYYPRPKTTKEKIDDIKESVVAYAIVKDIPKDVAESIIHLLDGIEG